MLIASCGHACYAGRRFAHREPINAHVALPNDAEALRNTWERRKDISARSTDNRYIGHRDADDPEFPRPFRTPSPGTPQDNPARRNGDTPW
jgi:hypothetical protein